MGFLERFGAGQGAEVPDNKPVVYEDGKTRTHTKTKKEKTKDHGKAKVKQPVRRREKKNKWQSLPLVFARGDQIFSSCGEALDPVLVTFEVVNGLLAVTKPDLD